MDYEKHNDKRFFIPLTEAQAKTQPDIEATKKAFAILQHKTRIEQILKGIEDDANILKEGDTPVIVDKTITNVTAPVMPIAVPIFFETPRNGQIPRNCVKTMLLTMIADMMIKMYSIFFPILNNR